MPTGQSAQLIDTLGMEANCIKLFTETGLVLGTNQRVNNNGTTYRYAAWGLDGTDDFICISYLGNGVDNRQINCIGFEPDMVWIVCETTSLDATWRLFEVGGDGDVSTSFAGVEIADLIQSRHADGVVIGAHSEVNSGLAPRYHLIAWKKADGVFASARYNGNGIDDRVITVAGMGTVVPTFAMAQSVEGATHNCWGKWTAQGTEVSSELNDSPEQNNRIQELVAGGVELGSSTNINSGIAEYNLVLFTDFAGVEPEDEEGGAEDEPGFRNNPRIRSVTDCVAEAPFVEPPEPPPPAVECTND